MLLPFIGFTQNALHLDGADDYVQTTWSGISGNSARTVEAWVKTTADAVSNQQVILDYGTAATGGRFTFNILWANAIRLEAHGNGLSGSIPVNDGNWHHVAAVYDPTATNKVSLYVDGVLDIAGNLTVNVNTGTTVPLRIGRRVDNAKKFEGSIDEVRVWNVARTQSQIQATKDITFCTMPSNLMAYYTFDQGVGGTNNPDETSLYDLSGNNYHGTLMNFALNGAASNWTSGATLTTGAEIGTQYVSSCDPYLWAATGQTYTANGEYTHMLSNGTGCDSLAVLRLSITGSNDLTTTKSECGSYTWNVNGMTYTQSGTYTEERTNSNGCTYDHHLNLTIHPMDTIVETKQLCLPWVWPVSGDTIPIAGSYYAVFTSVNGCDSVHRLIMNTWTNLQATLDYGPNYLVAGPPSFTKQWFDCTTGDAIPGATSDTLYVTQDGIYLAEVSDWGFHCPDYTDCFDTQLLGLKVKSKVEIVLSPNPANGYVRVEGLNKTTEFSVLNALGQRVSQGKFDGKTNLLDVRQLPNGVYFLQLIAEGKSLTKKLIVKH